MKTALHRLALRMGWYKDITKGMPLNICKTVFGATFFEGVYTARPIGELIQELYSWGWSDGEKAEAIGLPCDGEIKEIKEPDYVLEDRACRNPFYAEVAGCDDYNEEEAAIYWDKVGNAEPPF